MTKTYSPSWRYMMTISGGRFLALAMSTADAIVTFVGCRNYGIPVLQAVLLSLIIFFIQLIVGVAVADNINIGDYMDEVFFKVTGPWAGVSEWMGRLILGTVIASYLFDIWSNYMSLSPEAIDLYWFETFTISGVLNMIWANVKSLLGASVWLFVSCLFTIADEVINTLINPVAAVQARAKAAEAQNQSLDPQATYDAHYNSQAKAQAKKQAKADAKNITFQRGVS